MNLLLAAPFILTPLFPEDTPEEKRIEILAKYFDPPPGGPLLRVDDVDRVRYRDDPMRTKGYIWVRPPKGHCFIVMRAKDKLDQTICEPKRISFQIRDLTKSGKVAWTIFQSENDGGTTLWWHTPYRIANFIPLGKFDNAENIRSPIYSCEASHEHGQRKIVLTFFDGRKWYIPLPDQDTLVEGKKEEKNLFVRVMTTNKDGEAEAEDASTSTTITQEDVKRKHAILALKLSGKYKEEEKKQYTFLVQPWEAYEMNSGRVMEVGGPLGLNGTCRYRLKGARFDEESGVVECFNTDNYDALYAHMTCSSELPEYPKKPAQEK
ncbi:hypothetical protein [Pseudobacteriovorax antillogorgiicola]|uniref:Uncharacterized protein n=1 Tax=Pseudobacteriovorax antillogorgiicola TaxID=1513793 RepID=A0A1Y6BVP0_9BACT|nr:hypothetical protein [Pseudobacteriovorax antillogorgiicola]TCS52346.1 hypothetical protein EDD56_10990 [Pseudobacteriovorax antillogorgiicola]SMF29662.1 hypothetical protein SAMN06296036_109123 [Pseudobacteriovorax antillogorgiicola]